MAPLKPRLVIASLKPAKRSTENNWRHSEPPRWGKRKGFCIALRKRTPEEAKADVEAYQKAFVETNTLDVTKAIMSSAPKKKIYYACFDIEKAGDGPFRHPVVSIGAVVGDAEGNVLRKLRINLKVDWPVKLADEWQYGDFEKRCFHEFWEKLDPALVETLKRDAHPQEQGWALFAEWFNKLELELDGELWVCSDNPSYDISNINVNLDRYCARPGMHYKCQSKGKYEYRGDIRDPTEMAKAFTDTMSKEIKAKAASKCAQTHLPDDDAENIYWLMIYTLGKSVTWCGPVSRSARRQ